MDKDITFVRTSSIKKKANLQKITTLAKNIIDIKKRYQINSCVIIKI